MKQIEQQNKNLAKLLRLMKENPTLRVVAMVDSDIVADDGYSWWSANFGTSMIDYVYETDERIYLKSDDEEELIELETEFLQLEKGNRLMIYTHEKQAEINVRALSWEKVITVKITI